MQRAGVVGADRPAALLREREPAADGPLGGGARRQPVGARPRRLQRDRGRGRVGRARGGAPPPAPGRDLGARAPAERAGRLRERHDRGQPAGHRRRVARSGLPDSRPGLDPHAADPHGRLRQPGEHAARAGRRPPARDFHPDRRRREPGAPGAPAVHGEPAARRPRRGRRTRARSRRAAMAAGRHRGASLAGREPGLARRGVRPLDGRSLRHPVRTGARVADRAPAARRSSGAAPPDWRAGRGELCPADRGRAARPRARHRDLELARVRGRARDDRVSRPDRQRLHAIPLTRLLRDARRAAPRDPAASSRSPSPSARRSDA